MARTITFGSSASGSKGTGGVSFNIPLVFSQSGDVTVVAVAYPINTISVSSIQDANYPNSGYNFVRRNNNGGITVEIWSSASTPAQVPTGGTITVTMSDTGFVCAGIAASYKGVGAQPGPGINSVSSSGSTLTNSFSQFLAGGWRVNAYGVAISTVFTPVSGNLRRQIIDPTSTISLCLMDSGGIAPSGTLSATISASTAYSGVSFELDPFIEAPYVNPFRPSYGSGRSAAFSNSV